MPASRPTDRHALKRGECAIPTEHIPQQPTPQELTEALHEALDAAILSLREQRSAIAAQAADALEPLHPALTTPSRKCASLDAALADALMQLPVLVQHAPPEEAAQAIKQLRRMLLSDRCRTDPDPDRDALNLTLCTRQAQLLEHRGRLLTTRQSIIQTARQLETIADEGEYELTSQHLQLLQAFQQTQEEYLAALSSEIDQLRTELRG